jgi:hypothetical protein
MCRAGHPLFLSFCLRFHATRRNHLALALSRSFSDLKFHIFRAPGFSRSCVEFKCIHTYGIYVCTVFRKGQTRQKTRTGQPERKTEHDNQNGTEEAGQDKQNRTARTRQPKQERQNRTAGNGKPEQDSGYWTARTRQAKQDRLSRTRQAKQDRQSRTRQAEQDCQEGRLDRTAKT